MRIGPPGAALPGSILRRGCRRKVGWKAFPDFARPGAYNTCTRGPFVSLSLRGAMTPAILCLCAAALHADAVKALADKLRSLDTTVLATDADKAKELQETLSRDIRQRRQAANDRETDAWKALKNKADWECYRDERIKALRASLGTFPPAPKSVPVKV